MEIDDALLQKFIKRYNIHSLIFQRSLERTKTPGELFDVLESIPSDFPISWDERERCWQVVPHFPIK